MKINKDLQKTHPSLMGEFQGVRIMDAAQEAKEEVMYLTPDRFKVLAEIIGSFMAMSTGAQPVRSKEVNELLKAKDTEVKFIESTRLGFYVYQIKYGEKEIQFILEPRLIPIFNFCINDMMRRHKKTPLQSYVESDEMKIYSPLVSVDEAVMNINKLRRKVEGLGSDEVRK